MRKALLYLSCAVALPALGQKFTMSGHIPGLEDGANVAILYNEDAQHSTMVETTVKNGSFCLTGTVKAPTRCTFITNNLSLVDSLHWPTDSIRWTYTDFFLDNAQYVVRAEHIKKMKDYFAWTPHYAIEGGAVQHDFNEYNKTIYQACQGNFNETNRVDAHLQWNFIRSHPHSVVSLFFANKMLQRGYRLSASQLDTLAASIKGAPGDTARTAEFFNRMERARLTVKGTPPVDLEIADTAGQISLLSKVIPQGKYVLIDFWASWCGICIAAMPDIKALLERYPGQLTVIGISCDKDDKAWRTSMNKHPMPWPEYRLTDSGYKGLFDKYQVDVGVPYYLLLSPEGKVICSPNGINHAKELIELK